MLNNMKQEEVHDLHPTNSKKFALRLTRMRTARNHFSNTRSVCRVQSSLSETSTLSPSAIGLSTPSHTSLVRLGSQDYKSPSMSTCKDGMSPESVKLADVLNVLDSEDESCIFIVRKISKLGFSAYDSLSQYFSKYGLVKKILLLPSRGKGDSRNRPASMGFVVMSSKSESCSVLMSEDHRVNHVDIQVQKFVRNTRVQVSDGGVNVTNAYIPKSYLGGKSLATPEKVAPVLSDYTFEAAQPVVSLEQLENLARSLLQDMAM